MKRKTENRKCEDRHVDRSPVSGCLFSVFRFLSVLHKAFS